MSGWAGFSDAELRKLKDQKDNKSAKVSSGQDPNEASPGKRVPNILSASKSRTQREAANPVSSTGLGGNKIPKQQTPVTATKPAEEKEEMVMEIKEEVTEIEDSEALSREINNLDKFRDQQKMIEEANKQRKALLSKTLTERQRKAREEAQKLSHIQKELQLLDNRLSADVTLIRSRIESASKDFLEAQRRYDRAEREFIEAKMDLQKKSDLKEQLTEHLYTIIHQNELRKAEKLSHLMNELEMESEGNGVKLSSLPPLSAFNAVGLTTLPKTTKNDQCQSGPSSSKNDNQKSTESSKSEKMNKNSESSASSEETIDKSVCHIITDSHSVDNRGGVQESLREGKRQEEATGGGSKVGVPQEKAQTASVLGGSLEREKSVPSSWTLDVIVKQEPEESV